MVLESGVVSARVTKHFFVGTLFWFRITNSISPGNTAFFRRQAVVGLEGLVRPEIS